MIALLNFSGGAQIVNAVHRIGRSDAWLSKHLGMDMEEILRLKQITGLAEAFRNNDFSPAWEPGNIEEDLNEL